MIDRNFIKVCRQIEQHRTTVRECVRDALRAMRAENIGPEFQRMSVSEPQTPDDHAIIRAACMFAWGCVQLAMTRDLGEILDELQRSGFMPDTGEARVPA